MNTTMLESLLATVLTKDQIQALREEIVAGARRLHKVVDENERARVRRDELLALMKRIDTFIETREGSPLFLRAIYSAAKEEIRRRVMPLIEEVLRQGEEEEVAAAASPARAAAPERQGTSDGAPRRRRRPRRRPGKRPNGPQPAPDAETD